MVRWMTIRIMSTTITITGRTMKPCHILCDHMTILRWLLLLLLCIHKNMMIRHLLPMTTRRRTIMFQ